MKGGSRAAARRRDALINKWSTHESRQAETHVCRINNEARRVRPTCSVSLSFHEGELRSAPLAKRDSHYRLNASTITLPPEQVIKRCQTRSNAKRQQGGAHVAELGLAGNILWEGDQSGVRSEGQLCSQLKKVRKKEVVPRF